LSSSGKVTQPRGERVGGATARNGLSSRANWSARLPLARTAGPPPEGKKRLPTPVVHCSDTLPFRQRCGASKFLSRAPHGRFSPENPENSTLRLLGRSLCFTASEIHPVAPSKLACCSWRHLCVNPLDVRPLRGHVPVTVVHAPAPPQYANPTTRAQHNTKQNAVLCTWPLTGGVGLFGQAARTVEV
jgi:hypothetical protein